MQAYLFESLAPLVFRSGRPFGSQADANDVSFPLPSTAAGVIRHLFMDEQGWLAHSKGSRAILSEEQQKVLQAIACKGAFLVRINDRDEATILVPQPADAQYFKNDDKTIVQRLEPQASETSNNGCDLPHGLLPVRLSNNDKKNKQRKEKQFWTLEQLKAWQADKALEFEDLQAVSLPIESRTHVQIHPHSQAAQDGQLFQTAAYDLQAQRQAHHRGWNKTHYELLIFSEAQLMQDSGYAKLGGEGRLSRFRRCDIPPLAADEATLDTIMQAGGFRLTLLTPAIFTQGWLPKNINPQTLTGTLAPSSAKLQLCAAALERWQAVSGWDLQNHRPKAMRKAVAAGAVYWFSFDRQTVSREEIKKLCFAAISDHPQDQKDGFGIASLAAWTAPTA